MTEDRLNRIEDKLDKFDSKLDRLTDIVATQASHDERITQVALRVNSIEERVNSISQTVTRNAFITGIAQWLAVLTIGGTLTWLVQKALG